MWKVSKVLPRVLTHLLPLCSLPAHIPQPHESLHLSPNSPFASVVPSILNVLFLKEGSCQTGEHRVEVLSAPCSPEPGPGALAVQASDPPSPTLKHSSLFLQRKSTTQCIRVRNWFCSEVSTGKTQERVTSQSTQQTQQKFQLDMSLSLQSFSSATQFPSPLTLPGSFSLYSCHPPPYISLSFWREV